MAAAGGSLSQGFAQAFRTGHLGEVRCARPSASAATGGLPVLSLPRPSIGRTGALRPSRPKRVLTVSACRSEAEADQPSDLQQSADLIPPVPSSHCGKNNFADDDRPGRRDTEVLGVCVTPMLSRLDAMREPVTNLYALMDAADRNSEPRAHSRSPSPNQVALIDHDPWRADEIPFAPAEAVRYNERRAAQSTSSTQRRVRRQYRHGLRCSESHGLPHVRFALSCWRPVDTITATIWVRRAFEFGIHWQRAEQACTPLLTVMLSY